MQGLSFQLASTTNIPIFSHRAFGECKERHIPDLQAQPNALERKASSPGDENGPPEREFAQRRRGSSPRRQDPLRKSRLRWKCHLTRERSETAFDALRRTLKEKPLDDIALIVRTIQICAAALRPMTFSELNIASQTTFCLLRDQHEEAQLSHETMKRIANGEIDYVKICEDLVIVDSSGNVEFFHADMQRAVSSIEFRHQFGIRNGDEALAAICIQHLRCGEQTEGMASSRAVRCPVVGQATCTFRAYATCFWKKHYLQTKGRSQWINSLLHEALLATVPRDGCSEMPCQRRCNRVLATALEMAATHDLDVLGRTYVEMGAEVGPCTHSSHTPLHTAVANSSTNMVKFLLEYGADPNAFANEILDSPQPLCGDNEDALPTALVDCGGPEHEDQCHCWRCCSCASGRTPLHVAAANGGEETMRLLVAGGARLETRTMYEGETALHLAAVSGNPGAVQYLIHSGANVCSQNFVGETAAQVALKENSYAVAKLLQSAASQATQEPLSDGVGVAYVEAGVGEKDTGSTVWNMQNLSLEDKSHEPSRRKHGEAEGTDGIGGTWVLV